MEKIMAVNAGSSSLKFQILNMPEETVISEGIVEKIGLSNPSMRIKYYDNQNNWVKEEMDLDIKNHAGAVKVLLSALLEKNILQSLSELTGVGHRVLHGGKKFTESILVNEDVINTIIEVSDLGPLHNPANVTGIKAFKEVLPNVPQVAVFDTSFHQTMAPEAYMYAVPYEWYEKYDVRRYGFHGTSHKYVTAEAAKYLNKKPEELRLVTVHIGNGASLAAVKYGKCVDTSMGLTPLAGIPMGTRSGDIDPAILGYVCGKTGLSVDEVTTILNKKSGYTGIWGGSSDARDLRDAQAAGNELADLAIQMQNKGIADYISRYYGYMGGIDAIIFTAGIGERSPQTRAEVCARLQEAYGIEIDLQKNEIKGEFLDLTMPNSKIKVLVIPTNEELMIARDVMRLK